MAIEKGPYLFKFDKTAGATRTAAFDIFEQTSGAPEIKNLQGFDRKKPDLGKTAIIDVVTDFEWTHTPAQGRHEVPFIRMSEYRVNFNSLLQNIRFLLHSLQDETLEKVRQNLQGVGPLNVGGKAANLATAGIEKFRDVIQSHLPGLHSMNEGNTAPYLSPYYGLYGASPSGFEYYMPYFDQNWKSEDSSWQDWSQGGGPLKQVYNNIFSKDGFLKTLASGLLVSPNALGTQIDRPKQYVYEKDSPSITVKYDLMNTTDVDSIVKNWQLIFLLLYQNLPNKTSKILSEPPVIYEVEIPGTFYSPFAYISNIKILNRGATRTMEIPVAFTKSDSITTQGANESNQKSIGPVVGKPTEGFARSNFSSDSQAQNLIDHYGENKHSLDDRVQVVDTHISSGITPADLTHIKTLIPDAFSVEITLQSLIPESKNLLFHSLLGLQGIQTGIFTASGQPGSGMITDVTTNMDILKNMSSQPTSVTEEGNMKRPQHDINNPIAYTVNRSFQREYGHLSDEKQKAEWAKRKNIYTY